jgi:pyrroline-5-carboxylate reductase
MADDTKVATGGLLLGKKIAVFGIGIMGAALARGLALSGAVAPSDIILCDIHVAKAQRVADSIGSAVQVVATPLAAASRADILLFATKPTVLPAVLSEIAPSVHPNQLIISIAAGLRIVRMEDVLPKDMPVIRAMPNTPATVNAGASAIARGTRATDAHVALALAVFEAVGKAVEVDEKLMDAVTGLSGSGPAYVFMLIEALMDGGVKAGLSRDTARLLAAQTVYGAAKMVLESDIHPAQLKDNVTTPGGTTIQAVAVLERAGLRTAIIDAIDAATQRSKELS